MEPQHLSELYGVLREKRAEHQNLLRSLDVVEPDQVDYVIFRIRSVESELENIRAMIREIAATSAEPVPTKERGIRRTISRLVRRTARKVPSN